MRKHWSRICVVLAAVVAAGGMWVSLCNAGKTPPPPPPPPGPGTIYFRESVGGGQDVWQMASDGTAKSFVFRREPPETDEPSGLDYGGYRWWIDIVDDFLYGYDVWAFAPDESGNLLWVKLTDVAKDGIRFTGQSLLFTG